jgi:hypothetical protein
MTFETAIMIGGARTSKIKTYESCLFSIWVKLANPANSLV